MNSYWYEVWADEGQVVPYILLLRPSSKGFEVLDPREGNKQVFESESYEEAKMWLLEDEFVIVGRRELDE
jgi:hypothetical protein